MALNLPAMGKLGVIRPISRGRYLSLRTAPAKSILKGRKCKETGIFACHDVLRPMQRVLAASTKSFGKQPARHGQLPPRLRRRRLVRRQIVQSGCHPSLRVHFIKNLFASRPARCIVYRIDRLFIGAMMRLSTRSRYGLRAMKCIALAGGEPLTSEEIAGREDVSKKYLDGILGALRGAGLIESHRGQGGGYTLSRAPGQISANEVVEVLEGGTALVPCLDDPAQCSRSPGCATREVWKAVSVAIGEVLLGVTIEDLASKEKEKGPALTD